MKQPIWTLVLLLAITSSCTATFAEEEVNNEESTTVTNPDANPAAQQPPVTQGDRTFTAFGQPLDMPYVPVYTGQKRFVRSRRIVNNKSGETGLECAWQVRETSDVVMDWFKTALQQMQWKSDNLKNTESVVAHRLKDGYRVMVHCHPGPSKQFPTTVVVSFSSFKPIDGESDKDTTKKGGPVSNSKPPQPQAGR